MQKNMNFLNLATQSRTIRFFDTSKIVSEDEINYILECARRTPSAANLQRIRYITISGDEAKKAFGKISLGGYLPESEKPTESDAAPLYIVVFAENKPLDVNLSIDVGINAQTIALAASENGLGSCMIRNFDSEYFASLVDSADYVPVLVIAVGHPSQKACIVDIEADESVKYYKNEFSVNCVPKRKLNDLILKKIQ